MLKQVRKNGDGTTDYQPPSGGCVLKHAKNAANEYGRLPAAFGRLCVETTGLKCLDEVTGQPPSGGCVLKPKLRDVRH